MATITTVATHCAVVIAAILFVFTYVKKTSMQELQQEFRKAARATLREYGREDPSLEHATLAVDVLAGESPEETIARVRTLGSMLGMNIARAQKQTEWSQALTGASFAPRGAPPDTLAQYEQKPPVRDMGDVASSYIERIHAQADGINSVWDAALSPSRLAPEI